MKNKLKIGLLVDGTDVPYWAASIIRKLEASDFAEITLIIENSSPGDKLSLQEVDAVPGSLRAQMLKIKRNFHRLLYIVFSMLDNRAKSFQPGFEQPCPLSELVPNAPLMTVNPVKNNFSDYFHEEDIEQIKSYKTDILFRLGFRILRGDILKVARFGVWSYHHGDNQMMRGGPSGFWELVSRHPQVGVILQILNEDLDGGEVLYRSWSLPDILLLKRQRQNVFMQSSLHFPRMVKRLYDLGESAFFKEIKEQNTHPQFYSKRMFVAPTNIEMLYYGTRHLTSYLKEKLLLLLFFRQWVLLVAYKSNGQMSESMWRFREILPPRDRIWADPFVIFRDGDYHVFIEEMPRDSGRGHISVLTVDAKGNHSTPTPVIQQPYHMSYPFLFEFEEELYMIPETGENGTIDLYRCNDFPTGWEHSRTLMSDVFAVDTTLHEHDGLWWMFVTIREAEGTNCLDELFIYSTDNPVTGQWTAHDTVPVSSDVRNARPAGQLFKYKGQLYRPSQNGSHRYGYGLKINQVQQLDQSSYRETCIGEIQPDWHWSISGTHTLNHTQGLTVSDALKLRLRWFG